MKKLVIGILAHVDAGKTTLSESMLYTSGSIRHLGRVDNKDAYLDNNAMERERGITIFSKQADFSWKDMAITLLDTPGPVSYTHLTHGIFRYGILFACKFHFFDKRKSHCTLSGMMGNRICYQSDVALLCNLLHNLGLADSRRSH